MFEPTETRGALLVDLGSEAECRPMRQTNEMHHKLIHGSVHSLYQPSSNSHPGLCRATKWVIADPVFSEDDVPVTSNARKGPIGETKHYFDDHPAGDLDRSVRESGVMALRRLHFSRQEADAIEALGSKSLKAIDFAASRAIATSPELGEYRILHFATHGLLNSQHPELSGIVLSLIDEHGPPQDGFLRLHDIYNLQLNADLVVLSACETIKWSLQSSAGASSGRFEVVDRSAAASRFAMLAGGNVGIGTTAPAAKLEVAGNIAFAPQTAYLSIPPVAFNPGGAGYVFILGEQYIEPNPFPSVEQWYAPVMLPDGVVVTEFRVWMEDFDDNENLAIELWRHAQDNLDPSGQLAIVISDTTSHSNPTKKFYTDATITPSLSVIDNSTFHYDVRFATFTDKIRIGAVRIKYTYTHP